MVIQQCGLRRLLFQNTKTDYVTVCMLAKSNCEGTFASNIFQKLPSRLIAMIDASSTSWTIQIKNFTEALLLAFASSLALVRVLNDACKRRISLLLSG